MILTMFLVAMACFFSGILGYIQGVETGFKHGVDAALAKVKEHIDDQR